MENFNLFSYDFLLKSKEIVTIMTSCAEICVILLLFLNIRVPVQSA